MRRSGSGRQVATPAGSLSLQPQCMATKIIQGPERPCHAAKVASITSHNQRAISFYRVRGGLLPMQGHPPELDASDSREVDFIMALWASPACAPSWVDKACCTLGFAPDSTSFVSQRLSHILAHSQFFTKPTYSFHTSYSPSLFPCLSLYSCPDAQASAEHFRIYNSSLLAPRDRNWRP